VRELSRGAVVPETIFAYFELILERLEMAMRLAPILAVLLGALSQMAVAQTDSTAWTFFPGRTLFSPLVANHEEPRIGFQQEIGSSVMKVAIGNAVEMFEYRSGTSTLQGSLLFFVYALANDYRGYLLKIDAADGYFGLGFSYHTDSPFTFRFRVIHLSAHLVDGHFNDETMRWRDDKIPFPFSRNYGELVGAYSSTLADFPLRLYAGMGYAPIIKPKEIRKFSALAGWELQSRGRTSAYLAHHFSLLGTPTYIGSNTLEGGVKFANPAGRGIRLFLVYQNGWDNFCEYYNERREFAGAGFAVEFW